MGQRAKTLEAQGILTGSGAKATVDTILVLLTGQTPVEVTLRAHGATWLDQVDHIVTGFGYELQPGTPDAPGAQKLRYHIALKRKT